MHLCIYSENENFNLQFPMAEIDTNQKMAFERTTERSVNM